MNEHNVNNSETKSSLSGKNNNNIKGFGVNKKEINENTTPEELIDNPHNRKIYEYKNGVNKILITEPNYFLHI